MKSQIHIIRVITNLHVGSGKADVGIIDNLIERDAVTGLPVIYASGFKGALRDYCTKDLGWKNEDIKLVFGSSPKDEAMEQGKYRFFDCKLLGIPVATTEHPYVIATSKGVLDEFKFFTKALGFDVAEDDLLKSIFGSTEIVKIFENKEFGELCDDYHLPIMARNCMEEGKENLWYEQVLPRESILYTIIQSHDEKEEEYKFDKDLVVQIGANASIGYGLCKISKLEI